MENQNSNISTLFITAYCFEKLLEAIFNQLELKYPGTLKSTVGQIFGFGGYNKKQPNLKKDLEEMTDNFINGKYLYDKKRELASGKPFIKLNRPYHFILFEYLGYKNVIDFVNSYIEDETERLNQLSLINSPEENQNFYYVSYHFGEYKEIVKAQVIVKDNWKNIEFKYLYPEENGSIKTFTYYGDIKKRADALHIQTRTFLDGKMVPGGENILYIGYGDPAKSKYILGVFSAFDINNKLIAVKSILERCATEEEMIQNTLDPKIPGYIAQEIRNQRIENEIRIPNDKLEISEKSPYYLTYEKISGEYKLNFKVKKNHFSELRFKIDPYNFKVSSLLPSVLINHDDIQLLHNGSILYLKLSLTGLSPFLKLDIYVKTYYLNQNTNTAQGIFCGVDFENRLINGEIYINFNPLTVE